MFERMNTMSSRDAHRQQKTPQGADRQEETVNTSGPDGGPSTSPARTEVTSRGGEKQKLMEEMVSRPNMIRA